MYVELHAHSYYSLLDGVPSPEALVAQAARYEMPALALTDHDALYGAPRFARAAAQAGLKPIFGAELTLANGGGHLTLLAENDQGYANLCHLITLARRDQAKGYAALPWRLLADHTAGLIALSGCRRGELARALLAREADQAQRVAERYAALFGPRNFFLEMQCHYEEGDRRLNAGLSALAHRLGLGLVATGNSHYLAPADAPLHDVLSCIRHRVPLERAGHLLRPNDEYYFRRPDEMAALFAEWPQALRATLEIAERCQAQLPPGPQALPAVRTPGGQAAAAFLQQHCAEKLRGLRLPAGQRPAYQAALARELAIIGEQNLADYFLMVWDLMTFARGAGIVCQGRGSAANSLVAYLLEITPIDPLATGLVFERFLSRERASAPDIDVDFAADRREEAIQYLYRTYGHSHAAMACTVVTLGARQALRDVGLALGFSDATLDRLSEAVDTHAAARLPGSESVRAALGSKRDGRRWEQLLTLAAQLDGFPRHLGLHNGGLIIARAPLHRCIPIEPASLEDRTVVQWDKDGLETAGWIKLDVLGLRALSAMNDACDLIAAQTGQRPNLAALRLDDPAVYGMIRRGETVGVFQVESRAQASLIPRFQPRRFADLTVQIALIRPGPVQANMVHPYLRRREGAEPVRYLHPKLEAALSDSLGIILFQEDVLKVARDLAGFTPGEGELLRRALSHKRAEEQLESFREKFLRGAQQQGVPPLVARQVFAQLKAFGGYSFSKAHAAAFAVLTYWSAWLRCHHPAAFFAGLLRHQPMGFYPKHVVVADAQRHGVPFRPVDLRHSRAQTTLEGGAIRLGLDYVHGFGPEHLEVLEAERQRGPFASVADLVARTGLERRPVEALVLAGACDHLGERRQLLWDLAEAYRLARRPAALPLYSPDERAALPPMDPALRRATVFAATGVSLDGHLTETRRDVFTRAGCCPIDRLRQRRHGQTVKVGGLVVSRQHPPTAKGFAFLALEDPGGLVNVILSPAVYAQYREATRRPFVIIEGTLQFDHGALNVVARQLTEV